jgi:hypothetical protein
MSNILKFISYNSFFGVPKKLVEQKERNHPNATCANY